MGNETTQTSFTALVDGKWGKNDAILRMVHSLICKEDTLCLKRLCDAKNTKFKFRKYFKKRQKVSSLWGAKALGKGVKGPNFPLVRRHFFFCPRHL